MVDWSPFSEKALDFLTNSDARLNILHGSVRSSKTINCTVRWLDYILTGPKGDLAMLGRTAATLQRNVLNDLFDVVGHKNYKWTNKQSGEFTILGRRVYCFGANNEDAESKIRGATFAGALCDEVSLYPQNVFNQLMARLSVRGAQCFCNTNPDSPYHWFYTDYIKNEEIVDKRIWHFVMEDNLSLDKDYIDSLKQIYTGVWYERMILGLWVAAEGRIYDMFDSKVHMQNISKLFQETKVHPKAIKYFVGCDYGTATVMTWGLYAKFPSGAVYKIREYYYDAIKHKKQRTDSEFADTFKTWLGDEFPEVIYVDPSAASWKLELMQRGYRVQDADNDVINGIRYVSTQLALQQYTMDESCIESEKEYMSYVWDKKAQITGKDKPLKTHDHTCDCDRYALYTESKFGLSGVY